MKTVRKSRLAIRQSSLGEHYIDRKSLETDMDVSVIIVSYNVAQLLDECIASVKKETSCKYEIIVIDNNSTDHSDDLLGSESPRREIDSEQSQFRICQSK